MSTPPSDSPALGWHRVAIASIAALAFLEALWEIYLAPLRPGGSWLALKALPLALLWLPIARGSRKARQIASLILPLYVAEAIVRAVSESGRHAAVAAAATVIGLVACVAVLMSFRAEKAGP